MQNGMIHSPIIIVSTALRPRTSIIAVLVVVVVLEGRTKVLRWMVVMRWVLLSQRKQRSNVVVIILLKVVEIGLKRVEVPLVATEEVLLVVSSKGLPRRLLPNVRIEIPIEIHFDLIIHKLTFRFNLWIAASVGQIQREDVASLIDAVETALGLVDLLVRLGLKKIYLKTVKNFRPKFRTSGKFCSSHLALSTSLTPQNQLKFYFTIKILFKLQVLNERILAANFFCCRATYSNFQRLLI